MGSVLNEIKTRRIYYDGGCGTFLQGRGLGAGEQPDLWNLTHAEEVIAMHAAYLAVGCNIINTNTFGANCLKFDGRDGRPALREVVCAAVQNVRTAIAQSGRTDAFCSLDIGPTGRLLVPFGDLPFEEAVEVFAETIRIGAEEGVDLITIETMNDAYETKAAVLAAKESCALPVFVTNVYDERTRLMTGADPETMIALLEGLDVSALGMNCSLGPVQMKEIAPRFVQAAHVPVIVTPNAGLPHIENGATVYDIDAAEFAAALREIASCGASVIGGCCGTTPEHLRAAIEATRDLPIHASRGNDEIRITSYTKAVLLGDKTEIDRTLDSAVNETFADAIAEGDTDVLSDEAMEADEAEIICITVGEDELDPEFLAESVAALQAVCDTPLAFEIRDAEALARALRIYNGRPLVSLANVPEDKREEVRGIAEMYGAACVSAL